jgi:hypothetical protein
MLTPAFSHLLLFHFVVSVLLVTHADLELPFFFSCLEIAVCRGAGRSLRPAESRWKCDGCVCIVTIQVCRLESK